FFQAEDGIRDLTVTGVQTCALPIFSCEGSVRLIREAKRRRLQVTCEATPHHFTLDDGAVEGYATNAKMNPPLRLASDVEAVREEIGRASCRERVWGGGGGGCGEKKE